MGALNDRSVGRSRLVEQPALANPDETVRQLKNSPTQPRPAAECSHPLTSAADVRDARPRRDARLRRSVTENAPLFAVVDMETTGFSPLVGDRIIELGIVRVAGDGSTVDAYVTLVNPLRDLGPTHVHGITREDVENAPLHGGRR